MKVGDNASAPAHAGPLNHCEGLVPQNSAASPSMMVASDPANGVARHRPGAAFPVHRSFNAVKCRHEGCTAMLQSGLFCKQHAQLSSSADANGIRKPSVTRNVPIVPSQPRSTSFNGIHTYQRQDAPPYTSASPSNSKKLLPDRMVARKSGSTMPFMPARTDSPTLYASNTSQPNDSRPHKRQRASESYRVADSLQGGRSAFPSEVQNHLDGGRPRPPHGSPLQPNVGIPPTRPQPGVLQHPNGLHSPVTTGASPTASPAWGSPLLQSRPLQYGPRTSPQGVRLPVPARPPNGHSGLANGVNVPRSQQVVDQRDMNRVQQPSVSREYRLGSNGVASPLVSQDKSAVALYEQHRRDNMSHAELKARMQDAKLCPNPRSPADEATATASLGGQTVGSRNTAKLDSSANTRPEQYPPRAAPARPSNWCPPVPSMSSLPGWPHGSAAIDLTRSSNSPIEIPGSRPQSSGNTQTIISQVKATTSSTAPSPNISMRSVDLEVCAGKEAVAISQKPSASPKPVLVTGDLQNGAVDLTISMSRPMSKQTRTPTKQKYTNRHEPAPEEQKPDEPIGQTEAPKGSISNHSTVPPIPVKSDTERRQRIQRQLEAAKRAEDALRRGLALMPFDGTNGMASDNGLLHKNRVNGILPNSTTSFDSDIALVSPTAAEGTRLTVVSAPERRRLELVKRHDPSKLDGFIYGELNEPCRPMSRLFRLLPEERPPQKTKPAQRFAYIDPRVHWAKPRSGQWHDDMRTKLQVRGNKKEAFGKAAARQMQRKRKGSPAATANCLPMEPPERVAADPQWLAALKVLDEMAVKHRADEKSKAAAGELGKSDTQAPASTKETGVVAPNGDISSNRRSGRHNSRQKDDAKSVDTTPRRVLRTKNSSRRLNATIDDADESEDEDEEHSIYGASAGHKMNSDRMEIDTTPTRKRR